MESNNTAAIKYRADIDGLRAIAVLSVIVFHGFPELVPGGFVGVDVFFVISGFLITRIIFQSLECNRFSFAEFYARRIRRIFPALIVVLLASYVFGWFALMPDEYAQLGKHIAAGAGFASNFVLSNEAGYFDNAADTKPLLHLWSLGIEEQFYIGLPLLLWAVWFLSSGRKSKSALLTIAVLVALLSLYLNLKGVRKNATITFFLPHTRIWELLLGGVLAWVTLFWKRFNSLCWSERAQSNVLSVCGAALLACAFWGINRETQFPGHWALLPTLGAGLLILGGSSAILNRVMLSSPPLVWIGLISYPLYLWHWPLLSFARIVEDQVPSDVTRIGAILLALILAWLTYTLLERPIRRGEPSNAKTAVLLVVMTCVGAVGYHAFASDGWPSRFKDKPELRELLANPWPEVPAIDCSELIPEFKNVRFDKGRGGRDCKLSQSAPPKLLFIGDSHLRHYESEVWRQFSDVPILSIVATSCLPAWGSESVRNDCLNKRGKIAAYLSNNSSIETVILSGYWSYLIAGDFHRREINWKLPAPVSEKGAQLFKRKAADLVGNILNSGKKVIIMKDIPDLDFDINTCFDIRPLRLTSNYKRRQDCSIRRNEYIERIRPYDDVLSEFLEGFPEVIVYDPRPIFCRDDSCFASDGSLPFYKNGDHLNRHGARLVVEDLIRFLQCSEMYGPQSRQADRELGCNFGQAQNPS